MRHKVPTLLTTLLTYSLITSATAPKQPCPPLFSPRTPTDSTEWHKNPDWSGKSPLPRTIGAFVDISDEAHPIPTRIFFSIVEINDLPRDLQRLVRTLQKAAKPLTPHEAEVGALVAHYGDANQKTIRFTSRRSEIGIDTITAEDTYKAINESRIFPNRQIKKVDHVIHLHTHPNLQNPKFGGLRTLVLPSFADFELWTGLRSQLRERHEPLSFYAIVIPLGAAVEDVVFQIEDWNLDAYLGARKSSESISF